MIGSGLDWRIALGLGYAGSLLAFAFGCLAVWLQLECISCS